METFKLVLQIVGVALGLWYLWLEYRANIWLWLVGLVMPMVNGVLYAMSGLYADMGMNIYYIIAGLYGWIVWSNQRPEKKVSIGHTPRSYILPLLGATLAIWGLIWWVLVSFTDSTVPVLDSLTTALSIVATWMLAQKYVEQWLVWLVVDAITVGLYIYKGIPITASLYGLYTLLAWAGYRRWLRQTEVCNRKAIIVGATSGIGQEVASRLVQEGWTVGITGRRTEALEAFRAQYGSKVVHTATMDVTKPSATEALDTLLGEMGAPDLLLYASGVGRQNPELDESIELRTVQTNCEGMVRIVDHFLNYVKSSEEYASKHKAHIAVITSVAGTAGMGSAPAYSASKRMQSTYISALVQHCRMQGIHARFSDIRPGFVDTAILNPEKHYPILMSRDKAARCILRGLRRHQRIITFDWRFRLIVAFWRAIPRCRWERLTFIKN